MLGFAMGAAKSCTLSVTSLRWVWLLLIVWKVAQGFKHQNVHIGCICFVAFLLDVRMRSILVLRVLTSEPETERQVIFKNRFFVPREASEEGGKGAQGWVQGVASLS